MSVRKKFWPISNAQPEDAMFTIVIDSDQHLFKAGSPINGFIFINFKETGENLDFKELNLCLRESISLPGFDSRKKNVNTHVIEEQTLLQADNSSLSDYLLDLNNSKELKIPFEIVLPGDSASSFNSSEVTICYELKADLHEMYLCGELCDISTTLPIEILETPNGKNTSDEPTAQLQEAVDDHLITFYASLKKGVYSTGENLMIDFYLDAPACPDISMIFEIQQLFCLKGERLKTSTVEIFEGDFKPVAETGILLSKYTFLLENTIFTTQPSVACSPYVQVRYHVNITAFFNEKKFEIFIPVTIERNEGIYKRYPKMYSDEGYPLLPLTVTVQELKNDGLQSYIPMKQCYENNRLTVKKGQVGGTKAILTIISESFKAYTKEDTIKGFVYLSVSNIPEKVVFDKLLIVLVGVCQYKQTGTLHKNGEMFLFESKVLRGSRNNNHSPVSLSKPSAGIVVEFEFDLNNVKKDLPPTFNSDHVFISYELKADVFNLALGNKKASLYTKLPIIIKDNKVHEKVSIPKSIGRICKKDFSISLNMDKPVYKHRDDICLKINLENKTKKQITVRICLTQFTECMQTNQVLHEVSVSKPIMLLVHPKSKMASSEKITLKDNLFHFQPTLLSGNKISVTYSIVVDVPNSEHAQSKNKLAVPVAINRKRGYEAKELSCEGYPLLPLTLEYYSGQVGGVPSYLRNYEEHSMITVLSSGSCYDRWKSWKLK